MGEHRYSVTTDLFTLPYEDESRILYAPRVGFVCVANPDLLNLLAELDTLDGDDLGEVQRSTLRFLQQNKVLNSVSEADPVTNSPSEYTPTQVTLFATNNCNLRCRYCYAAAGDWTPLTMDWRCATSAIERVIQNLARVGGKQCQLGFHGGGEPLFAWNFVQRVVGYAEERCAKEGLDLKVYSATNGVLNEDQLRWIVEHFCNLNISFDGLPRVQDYHRPCANGTGSFAYVDRTMRFLDEHDFNYAIRCTVSNVNVDLMDETIHFIGQNYRARLVHVEPLFYCGRCRTSDLMQPAMEDFAASFAKCESLCIPYGIELTYSGAQMNCLRNSFCGATRDNFAVTPDGLITTCFEVTSKSDPKHETFVIGQIGDDGEIEVDEAKRAYLNGLTVDKLEYCSDCFAKWHCAGDCVVKIGHDNYGGARGHERCLLNRLLISNRLRRAVDGVDRDPITAQRRPHPTPAVISDKHTKASRIGEHSHAE